MHVTVHSSAAMEYMLCWIKPLDTAIRGTSPDSQIDEFGEMVTAALQESGSVVRVRGSGS